MGHQRFAVDADQANSVREGLETVPQVRGQGTLGVDVVDQAGDVSHGGSMIGIQAAPAHVPEQHHVFLGKARNGIAQSYVGGFSPGHGQRQRGNDEEAQLGGLPDFLGCGAGVQPDGIETSLAEHPERGIGVANGPEEVGFVADHEVFVVQLDLAESAQIATKGRPCGAGRLTFPSRGLEGARVEDRSYLQVVDEHVNQTGAGVDVEHEAIDVGVGNVDVVFVFVAQQLLLIAQKFDAFVQFQNPPTAGPGIGVAADEGGQGFLQAFGIGLGAAPRGPAAGYRAGWP